MGTEMEMGVEEHMGKRRRMGRSTEGWDDASIAGMINFILKEHFSGLRRPHTSSY